VRAGQNVVEENGNLRQSERMIHASDRATQVAQQLVVLMLAPEIIHEAHAFQPLGGELVPENVLEGLNLTFESLEHLRGSARTGETRRSFKHPAFDALFLFLWRKIRERE